MRVALTIWNGRISPVFDVASRFLFLDIENNVIKARNEEGYDDIDCVRKVARIAGAGVKVMICGAVSRPLFDMLTASGIEVFPFITGSIDEVVEAYMKGNLSAPALAMPGCCGRMRQRQGRRGRGCAAGMV